MIQTLQKLKTDAWRTASARYNAARRLRRREIFATISLALMSSLTVAMAFLQRVYATGTPADNYITAVSGTLGIFLLTVSLVEWGARTGAVAEVLHQNAEKLNGFSRRVGIEIVANTHTPLTFDDVKRLNAEYEAIKDDCQHNHLPLDDLYFRSHHLDAPEFLNGRPGPAMTRGEVVWIWCKWQSASLWYIAAIWFLLVSMLVPLFTGKMWDKDHAVCSGASTSIPAASPAPQQSQQGPGMGSVRQ
jgi:hypothetical protein